MRYTNLADRCRVNAAKAADPAAKAVLLYMAEGYDRRAAEMAERARRLSLPTR